MAVEPPTEQLPIVCYTDSKASTTRHRIDLQRAAIRVTTRAHNNRYAATSPVGPQVSQLQQGTASSRPSPRRGDRSGRGPSTATRRQLRQRHACEGHYRGQALRQHTAFQRRGTHAPDTAAECAPPALMSTTTNCSSAYTRRGSLSEAHEPCPKRPSRPSPHVYTSFVSVKHHTAHTAGVTTARQSKQATVCAPQTHARTTQHPLCHAHAPVRTTLCSAPQLTRETRQPLRARSMDIASTRRGGRDSRFATEVA